MTGRFEQRLRRLTEHGNIEILKNISIGLEPMPA